MSIVRDNRKKKHFYILENRIIEDKNLSWAARGMLVFLLSKPDHWEVSVAALVNETENSLRGPAGNTRRDGVRVLLTELKDAGYIKRSEPSHALNGDFDGYDYIVSENSPATDPAETANPSPVEASPLNPPLVNTDIEVNTEKAVNTKKLYAPSAKIALDADGSWSHIPENLLTTWKAAYPAVDLQTELAKASAWIIANPKNRKSNYARYLTNWLNRAQDNGRRVAPKVFDDWGKSDEGILRKADELGISPRGGESYASLKARIFETMNRRGAA